MEKKTRKNTNQVQFASQILSIVLHLMEEIIESSIVIILGLGHLLLQLSKKLAVENNLSDSKKKIRPDTSHEKHLAEHVPSRMPLQKLSKITISFASLSFPER